MSEYTLADFLQEEMDARGWTARDVAMRMGGTTEHEIEIDWCTVDLALHVHDTKLLLDAETAEKLGHAFDVPPEFLVNLDASWRKSYDAAQNEPK